MNKFPLALLTLLFAASAISASLVRGQVSDLIAGRSLVLRGHAKAEVQLLSASGEIVIADTAIVSGDLRLPEDPANTGGDGPTRRIAATVEVQLAAQSSASKGQLRESASFDLPILAGPQRSRGTQPINITGREKSGARFDNANDIAIQDVEVAVELPPGAYGQLAIRNARVLLGVAGAYRPARYDFAALELTGGSRIQLAGPVIITAGRLARFEGVIGREDLPAWLDLRITAGDIQVKGASAIHGSLYAPNSSVALESGASAEGWLAGEAVTIERGGRFTARPFDWDPAARGEVHPAFPRRAVLIQNRLAGFNARVAGQYTADVAYLGDVPTLTLSELPRRDTEKPDAKDRAIFFDAFRVLLAGSFAEEARVIIRRSPGNNAPAAEPIDVRMSATDFEGHLWAVGQEAVAADSVRKIQASSGLQQVFMLRSLTVAKAALGMAGTGKE